MFQLSPSRLCLAGAFLLSSLSYSLAATVQEVGLTQHNQARAKHQVGPMTLDSALNAEAQRCALYYATYQKIDHSCKTAGAGECLYMSWVWGTAVAPDQVNTTITGIKSWYDENKGYNYNAPGSSTGVIGHFTQMVWKGSTLLGIGVSTVGSYTVVVGKYKPQGNIYGGGTDGMLYFRQNVFPPK